MFATVLAMFLALGVGAVPATAGPNAPAAPGAAAPRTTRTGPADRPDGALPPGWNARPVAGGVELSYDAGRPIPRTDAGVRVVAGGRTLGPAAVTGTVAAITLPRLPEDTGSLSLVAGTRPIGDLLDRVAASTARDGAPGASRAVPAPATATVPASLTPRTPEPVTAVDYELPPLKDPQFSAPLRVLARVIGPRAPRADRPLVLFAHGRHGTCYRRGEVSGSYPCPKGWRPIPSLLGYEYAQRLLAGQGFVTVSIDLNGVNGQDDTVTDGGAGARARLVRHHLRTLAGWNANPETSPIAKRLSLRFDPRSILLVGHSRGGEGVARAVAQAGPEDPYAVTGLLLLAPTDFARATIPNVPTTVILPGCDGDVSDLQGQVYVDRALDTGGPTALHTAVYVPGSNHNSYNSEWTPATARAPAFDDAEMSGCTVRGRLGDAGVRSVGAMYALATAFAYLTGEDRGTGLLDGSVAAPPGSNVRGMLVTPVGGPRRLLWRGNAPGTPPATVAGGRLCHSLSERAAACTNAEEYAGPHWLALDERIPRAARLALARRGDEAGLRLTDPVALDAADWLDLRVVVPPGKAGRLAVRVADDAGRSTLLAPVIGASVRGLPSLLPKRGQAGWSGRWWGQLVRVPLRPASQAGVDLHRLRGVSLVTAADGLDGAVLLDVSAGRPGLGRDQVDPAPLPRLDPGATSRVVPEGSTTHTVMVAFELNRAAATDIDVVAMIAGSDASLGPTYADPLVRRLRLPAGSTRLEIPVTVPGDRLDSPDRGVDVTVEVHGPAVTGDWISTLTIRDDDPAPRLRIAPAAAAVEGRPLVWVARLDRPSGQDVSLEISALPSRRELSSADLTASARSNWNVDGKPVRPLSRAGLSAYLSIPAGKTSVAIVMDSLRDRRREGTERVALRVVPTQVASTRPVVLTGTVTDSR